MKRLLLVLLLLPACVKVGENSLDASTPAGWILTLLLISRPLYIAVGAGCSSWTSRDAITWTEKSGSGTPFTGCSGSANIYDVTYGNGIFVAVGETSTGAGCGIWTSSDGFSWSKRDCGNSQTEALRSVGYGLVGSTPTFVAGAVSSAVNIFAQRSTDGGGLWNQSILFPCGGCAGNFASSVRYSASGNFLAGYAGSDLRKSSDGGSNWTFSAFASGLSPALAFPNRLIRTSGITGLPDSWTMVPQQLAAQVNAIGFRP